MNRLAPVVGLLVALALPAAAEDDAVGLALALDQGPRASRALAARGRAGLAEVLLAARKHPDPEVRLRLVKALARWPELWPSAQPQLVKGLLAIRMDRSSPVAKRAEAIVLAEPPPQGPKLLTPDVALDLLLAPYTFLHAAVHGTARRALKQLGDEGLEPLLTAMAQHPDPRVRSRVIRGVGSRQRLWRTHNGRIDQAVLSALRDPVPEVREAAACTVRHRPEACWPAAIPTLFELASDPCLGVRIQVVLSLSRIQAPPDQLLQVLLQASRDPSAKVRWWSQNPLLRFADDPRVLSAFLAMAQDPAHDVREAAVRNLGRLDEHAAEVVPALAPCLADDALRRPALQALRQLGARAEPAVPALTEGLTFARTRWQREALLSTFESIGTPKAYAALTELLKAEDTQPRLDVAIFLVEQHGLSEATERVLFERLGFLNTKPSRELPLDDEEEAELARVLARVVYSSPYRLRPHLARLRHWLRNAGGCALPEVILEGIQAEWALEAAPDVLPYLTRGCGRCVSETLDALACMGPEGFAQAVPTLRRMLESNDPFASLIVDVLIRLPCYYGAAARPLIPTLRRLAERPGRLPPERLARALESVKSTPQ